MKISCGGFELSENDFELNGETLSLKNGGGSGGGGVMIVNDVNGTLDKTWQEIQTAMATSVVVIYQVSSEFGFWAHFYVIQVRNADGNFIIEVSSGDQYRATSASGYPVYYDPI